MRVMQLEACVHPFFDELRDLNCRLPNGRPLPPLFNFKPQGVTLCLIAGLASLDVGLFQVVFFMFGFGVRFCGEFEIAGMEALEFVDYSNSY